MASNKELSDAILKLNPSAVVDGLKNVELEALLSMLSAPSGAVKNDPVSTPSFAPSPRSPSIEEAEKARLEKAKEEADVQAKAQAEANAAEEAARKGDATHKVVEGKAITCKRDVISGDDAEDKGGGRVSARDFHEGKVDVDRLVAAGVLVRL